MKRLTVVSVALGFVIALGLSACEENTTGDTQPNCSADPDASGCPMTSDYPEMTSDPAGFPASADEGDSFGVSVDAEGGPNGVSGVSVFLYNDTDYAGGASLDTNDGTTWSGTFTVGEEEFFGAQGATSGAKSLRLSDSSKNKGASAAPNALVSGDYYPEIDVLDEEGGLFSAYYYDSSVSTTKLAVMQGSYDPDTFDAVIEVGPDPSPFDAFSVAITGVESDCGFMTLNTNGTPSYGTVAQYDTCYFEFFAGASTQYTVTLTPLDGDPDLYVCDPNLQCYSSENVGLDIDSVVFSSTGTGNVSVEVYGYEASEFSVSVTMGDGGPTCAATGYTEVFVGQSLYGEYVPGGYGDTYYCLYVTSGNYYSITMDPYTYDDDLYVYDWETAGAIFYDYSNLSGSVPENVTINPAPSTGPYIIDVYGYSGSPDFFDLFISN